MSLAASFLLLLSASAFIYDQGAQNGQYEARIKQPQPIHAVLTFATHEPQTQTEHNDPYDPRRDCLYRAYLAATILGVFAALGGIYAIYKQTEATKQAAEATAQSAKETAKSAKAAEDSVRLQESALRSWVNIGDWKVWIVKKTSKLRIRFHVINPTELPVDLGTIKFGTEIMADAAQEGVVGVDGVLAPHNPYIVDAELEFDGKYIDMLTNSKPIVLAFECSIVFADIRQKQWEQIFKRFIIFDKHILDVTDLPDNMITPHVRDTGNQLRQYEAH
ncbi:MAG TPA: hypothetical protein VN310_03920 [Candidatus Dormibacteraeota bacterium]|nr:hypothetical protein [Candidatus Dormibacteraeota bacterium]